jgi:hypothetical protein
MNPTIPEFCPIDSPTLRCEKRVQKNGVLQVCVKYKIHTTPCHFEPFAKGILKPKERKEALE